MGEWFMGLTSLLFVGYLLFVLLSPAKFDLVTFVVPLIVVAIIELFEGVIKR